MADIKMPEINNIVITGNLTRDPVFRQTANGSTVVNFSIASNRRYRDTSNQWQSEVCYIGVVAWNRLADSCNNMLKKGSAVLVDGEIQSHLHKNGDGTNRTVIEIKARRIQFLNKKANDFEFPTSNSNLNNNEEELSIFEDDSFDKFLTSEESLLLKEQSTATPQG